MPLTITSRSVIKGKKNGRRLVNHLQQSNFTSKIHCIYTMTIREWKNCSTTDTEWLSGKATRQLPICRNNRKYLSKFQLPVPTIHKWGPRVNKSVAQWMVIQSGKFKRGGALIATHLCTRVWPTQQQRSLLCCLVVLETLKKSLKTKGLGTLVNLFEH